jgi:hypothetical protein
MTWKLPEIPFYCETQGYRPILHHDNNDLSRITYLTERYNRAVRNGLIEHPEAQNLLVVDSYYLDFVEEIRRLIDHYRSLQRSILGASIWYCDKSRVKGRILYYDTLSVREFKNMWWSSLNELPRGLVNVTGVGGCFIFPRTVWEGSGRFSIPYPEPQAGGSRCLKTEGYRILLDCGCRLWRSHLNNPGIPDYSLTKRLRVSAGELRRRVIRRMLAKPE